MDALDIFEPAGIRFFSVQHEQNAVRGRHFFKGSNRKICEILMLFVLVLLQLFFIGT